MINRSIVERYSINWQEGGIFFDAMIMPSGRIGSCLVDEKKASMKACNSIISIKITHQ